MQKEPLAIARAVFDAYVAKDRPAIELLVAPDFHFTSPLDNRLDRATYFTRCWPNSKSVRAFEYRELFAHGDRVWVTYVPPTWTATASRTPRS